MTRVLRAVSMTSLVMTVGSSMRMTLSISAGIYGALLPGLVGFRYGQRLGHLLGYARVSTTDQDAALRIDALNVAGCYRVFVDTVSGSLEHRRELDKLLDQIRPGDTLVVWRLDRFERSIRHLTDQLQALADRGVEFRSLQETIVTTSPGGRLVFHAFDALAELERDLRLRSGRSRLARACVTRHDRVDEARHDAAQVPVVDRPDRRT